jgi:hypothetical protein
MPFPLVPALIRMLTGFFTASCGPAGIDPGPIEFFVLCADQIIGHAETSARPAG